MDLGQLEPAAAAAWEGLFDVADLMSEGWAIAGGQMIYVHCQEHGASPERPSDDGDVVLDVRARPRALSEFVGALTSVGFTSDGMTWQGYQHRWVRGDAQIDVLVPRHLGSLSELKDKMRGISTIAAPGSQHLLNRSERIEVSLGDRTSIILRPDLMGAIAAKAAAYREIVGDQARDRHLIDVLVLAGFLSARELRGKDPWRGLESRRIAHAVGAIRQNSSVQSRFSDTADRIERLTTALRYFE